ncbi:MAG: CoA transferase [Chitinophagaceae bacterium]|nr:MAG: CoA transferase [Chitinophagaceae bacterium]
MELPLKGIVILEFSQYLSGPCAGLRLADFGAEVIKVERPKGGDAGRRLSIENLWVDDSSLLFHTINRNKKSITANLKDPDDLRFVRQLIVHADVITHNFRPGIMASFGLDYASVQKINPRIIYAEISGYGKKGPWSHKPGQDLLIQSISGLTYTTGNAKDHPIPFGLAMSDYLCGNQTVQAILAALIRRHKTGKGALLELSLLESLIDFQFEYFTTYFQSKKQPKRSEISNGHPLLGAPYGIYKTSDGYIAIAMMPLKKLNAAIECIELNKFTEEESFKKRDEIKAILSNFLLTDTTAGWLKKVQKHDLWIMPVSDWNQLIQSSTYRALNIEQEFLAGNKKIKTTRCPIRYNKQYFLSDKPAPKLGEHIDEFKREIVK